MKLTKVLIQIGLIKLLKSDVKRATKKRDFSFLDYAYTNGLFNVRLEIVKELVKLPDDCAIPILEKAIFDKIPVISIMAIESLALYPTSEQLEKIKKRLEFWEKESEKKAFLRNCKRKPYSYHWDSAKMQKLKQEAMKNMKSFGERAAYM